MLFYPRILIQNLPSLEFVARLTEHLVNSSPALRQHAKLNLNAQISQFSRSSLTNTFLIVDLCSEEPLAVIEAVN